MNALRRALRDGTAIDLLDLFVVVAVVALSTIAFTCIAMGIETLWIMWRVR